jgi:hypothetical protein
VSCLPPWQRGVWGDLMFAVSVHETL